MVGQELAQDVVQGVQGAGRNLMDVLFVDLRDTGRMNVQREELPRIGVQVVTGEEDRRVFQRAELRMQAK